MPQALALALFNIGAPLAIANAVVGVGVGGTILYTGGSIALSIGASYLVSVLFRPTLPKPSDGALEFQQPIPPRVSIYGRMLVAGPISFYERSPTFSRDLFRHILLCAREIDAIEEHRLDDSLVTIDGSGNVTGGTFTAVANFLFPYLGTDSQAADARTLADFPEWTSNHRLRGIAYVVAVYNTGGNFEDFTYFYPHGVPAYRALIRGAKVYDPRLDGSISGGTGAHRHNNKATWAWSDNAALVVLDYLTHADGYNRPIAKIDRQSFQALADVCDEAVTLKLRLVDREAGTNIGDMTAGGGLAAAFDGVTNEPSASCAVKLTATSVYIGKALAEPIIFDQAVVRGSNDNGFVSGANPSLTINIRGKNGVPASATDGTIIGTLTFADTVNESGGSVVRTILSTDTVSSWTHVFAQITHGGAAASMSVAELHLYHHVGDEPRYRVATAVSLIEPRTDVLKRLLEACDATLQPTAAGTWKIVGGEWVAPTVTIDADQGHIIEAEFSGGPSALERYNELAIQYLSPDHDYTEVEGDPWQDAADIAATGIVEARPLDLLQVPSHSQARRLAKLRMARDNAEWFGTIKTNEYGLDAIGERCVSIVWSELGINGPFWIEEMNVHGDGTGVTMRVRSADEASYAWDPETEEGDPPPVPPEIVYP